MKLKKIYMILSSFYNFHYYYEFNNKFVSME